ncbi:MAG: ATP-binding protein, partial [Parasulfuritortus sp.]|nr:ATP-binding protein [Parasulfuritortus sp.]
ENINKILRLSVGRARAKGLKLTYIESNPLPPCLSFDPQRLHQVILNLISNAIKFTQKGQIVVNASWIPLRDNDLEEEEVARVAQQQLQISSWKKVFDPLQEFDDPDLQSRKMLKITAPRSFVPSSTHPSATHL